MMVASPMAKAEAGWVVRRSAAILLGFLLLAMPSRAADWQPLREAMVGLVTGPEAPVSGVAVIVVRDGKTVFAQAAGRAVIDPTNPTRERPLTLDTPVRVASLSKLPVGIAVHQLAAAGKLDLDADLSPLLGFRLRNPHHPDHPITTRMLLTHTSSLRDAEIYGLPPPYSLEELVRPGGAFDPGGTRWADEVPGTRFTYTNLNYGVMATLIERLTGQRFDAVVTTQVLRPLGMRAAYDVRLLDVDRFQQLAPVYRRQPDGSWLATVDDYQGRRPDDRLTIFGVKALVPLAHIVPGRNGTSLSPQGGMRASARDLAMLLHFLLDRGGGLLPATAFDRMLTPHWTYDPAVGNGDVDGGLLRQWALGIHCTTHGGGPGAGDRWQAGAKDPRLCGHFGDAYGLLGAVMADPGGRWGFVYLLTGTPMIRVTGPVSSLTVWEQTVVDGILAGVNS
ncbi:serine hydrolase domain-containing protein [Niveispirillum lacus]|nr:serine hydrolase domain-containing protein [Niveispirillum lacus]